MQIAIIGGGPGGLTLARLLQLQGKDVKVYERDKDKLARQQGATLDLHEDSGLKALADAGLMEGFKQLYRPGADKIKITDAHAQVLYSDHDTKPAEDFGQAHFRPEIDRGPLRNLLVESLEEGTIMWDCQFTAMEKMDGRWVLHFKNGLRATADLVVAADGANSRVRPIVNDIQPVYSGITVVEGNIYHAAKNAPQLNALTAGGKIFAFGNEKSIILSAKGDGSLSFYTGTKETENWVKTSGINFDDQQQVLSWFKTRFGDWATGWQELFTAGELYIVPRPMYHYPINQHWTSQPDITLLGDAAHRMPPYAGEGVNMAMLDALELAECLGNGQSVADYEQRMLKRAAEITQLTLEQTEALHAPGALQHMISLLNGQH